MKINTNSKKVKELLTRGVKEVINKNDLSKKLLSGKRLKVKFGVDPSKPDIHIGHTVPLQKLQEFQKLGHQVVFIIGDFTGRIGDPSDRTKTRSQLSIQEVNKNAKTYLAQVKKVIDIKKIEVRRNSEWYDKMNPDDFIRLFSKITLARILERDDFEKRMKSNMNIYPHEIIYPILQAYDSVVINADVEIGGTDQKFNILMGRTLQKKMGKSLQDVMILPLLIGTDGRKKMSKSLNNYIGIAEPAREQYGKIMSISDDILLHYLELIGSLSLKEIQKQEKINPRDLKAGLAKKIVGLYYGEKAAQKTEKEFNRIFKEKALPSKMPVFNLSCGSCGFLDLLLKLKLAESKNEAKRLILQGGISIKARSQDQKIKVKDWRGKIEIKDGMVIQAGKRRFVKIRIKDKRS